MSDSTGSSVEYVGRVAQQTLHDYIAKIEELTVAHDRLRKENAGLREALQGCIPIMTRMYGKQANELPPIKQARAALQGAKHD